MADGIGFTDAELAKMLGGGDEGDDVSAQETPRCPIPPRRTRTPSYAGRHLRLRVATPGTSVGVGDSGKGPSLMLG